MNRFDEVRHQYYIGDRLLKSVTTFISDFMPKFNAPMVAGVVAKKRGVSAEHILNDWDLKRDIANNYGNSIHMSVERWLKFGEKPTQPHLQLAVDKFIEKFGNINWDSEYRVFSEEYELGGTMDLISWDSKIIADIKTNDTFKESDKKFSKPFNNLKANNLNKVRLQTKIYQELLGGEWQRKVFVWTGEDFEEHELEDIDVSEIMAIRKNEVELEKLLESI